MMWVSIHMEDGTLYLTVLSDINECDQGTDRCACGAGLSGCSSLCSNNDASYDCSCSTGYTLDNDGVTCKGGGVGIHLTLFPVI